jgi:hypothetical protein
MIDTMSNQILTLNVIILYDLSIGNNREEEENRFSFFSIEENYFINLIILYSCLHNFKEQQ